MPEALLKFVLAYALGNLMGGALIGRLRGGVDLRRVGSGNVGATNALRTQGKAFAVAVLLLDIAKGACAVWLIPKLPFPWPQQFVLPELWIEYLCGIGVTLGHCYPVALGFAGGKGVAALAGVFGALMPVTLAWMLLAFVATALLTGYASLATLLAAAVSVVYVAFVDPHGLTSMTGAFTVSMALLILFKHRQNVDRLLHGTEHRFRRRPATS